MPLPGRASPSTSRRGGDSLDNFGGYQIRDPDYNAIVAGSRFDFDSSDVEQWLANREVVA